MKEAVMLIRRVGYLYDAGYYVQEIANKLEITVDLVNEIIELIKKVKK